MNSVGKYSIYVYKDKTKCVNISRDIESFQNWIMNNVKLSSYVPYKMIFENKERLNYLKRDKIELFVWVNYLANILMLHDYDVSISMEL